MGTWVLTACTLLVLVGALYLTLTRGVVWLLLGLGLLALVLLPAWLLGVTTAATPLLAGVVGPQLLALFAFGAVGAVVFKTRAKSPRLRPRWIDVLVVFVLVLPLVVSFLVLPADGTGSLGLQVFVREGVFIAAAWALKRAEAAKLAAGVAMVGVIYSAAYLVASANGPSLFGAEGYFAESQLVGTTSVRFYVVGGMLPVFSVMWGLSSLFTGRIRVIPIVALGLGLGAVLATSSRAIIASVLLGAVVCWLTAAGRRPGRLVTGLLILGAMAVIALQNPRFSAALGQFGAYDANSEVRAQLLRDVIDQGGWVLIFGGGFNSRLFSSDSSLASRLAIGGFLTVAAIVTVLIWALLRRSLAGPQLGATAGGFLVAALVAGYATDSLFSGTGMLLAGVCVALVRSGPSVEGRADSRMGAVPHLERTPQSVSTSRHPGRPLEIRRGTVS